MLYTRSEAAGLEIPSLRRSLPTLGEVRMWQVLRQAERNERSSDRQRTSPDHSQQPDKNTDACEPPESVLLFMLRPTTGRWEVGDHSPACEHTSHVQRHSSDAVEREWLSAGGGGAGYNDGIAHGRHAIVIQRFVLTHSHIWPPRRASACNLPSLSRITLTFVSAKHGQITPDAKRIVMSQAS